MTFCPNCRTDRAKEKPIPLGWECRPCGGKPNDTLSAAPHTYQECTNCGYASLKHPLPVKN